MWNFPIPLAGNYAIIILVQTFISFSLFGTLSTLDILNGFVSPLNRNYFNFFDVNSRQCLGWLLRPPELLLSPVDMPNKSCSSRICTTINRTIVWFVLSFCLVWPIFTGTSFSIWGASNYNSYPQPELLSAALGGILAFLTCPIWGLVSLIDMGKRISKENEHELALVS